MPWQRHVLDIALEVDPDTGQLAYDEVRLTVPRQSGKTTLLLAMLVWRAHAAKALGGRQRMIYAAQSRNDARKKLFADFVPILEDAKAMRGRFTVRRANGSEEIRFRGGSNLGLVANRQESGHGPTLDAGCIDEAFSQRDDRVEQAMGPAMITRPAPQLWVVSTQGDDSSIYLNDKIDSGRELIRAGAADTTIAYIEWSAADELGDIDPADPAVWWSCMPALGHTVTEARIRGRYDSMSQGKEGVGGFCRAYLNIRRQGSILTVIPLPWWRDCADPAGQITGRIVLAVDVAPDRSWSAIALAGVRADGRVQVEIVDRREGTDWVTARVIELSRRNGNAAIVIDDAGPAGSLVADLRAPGLGLAVTVTTAKEMAQACGGLYDDARDKQLAHLGDPILEQALRGAATRRLGDGAWAWRRRGAGAEICALVAVTLARWGRLTLPESSTLDAFSM